MTETDLTKPLQDSIAAVEAKKLPKTLSQMSNEETLEYNERLKFQALLNKPKTLVQKLCEIMGAVGYTQKTGWNDAQKYHYVTEADIAEKIRPELAKRNVIIFPTMVKNERTRLERPMKEYTKFSYATDVLMKWTVVDGDTGEAFECEIPGCSESPGDKGVYVAMTGSEKYLLMKLFLLPTGDDPEDDANEPVSTKEAIKDQKTKAAKDIGEKKAAEIASNTQQSLFYVWHDESQTAEITGAESLKTANKDLLKPLWSAAARAIICNADQLEALKYEFEQRKVMFRPLKAANGATA